MNSEIDRIAWGRTPGTIPYYRPTEVTRPRRGDWQALDPAPADLRGPSGWGWVLVAVLLALLVIGIAVGPAA